MPLFIFVYKKKLKNRPLMLYCIYKPQIESLQYQFNTTVIQYFLLFSCSRSSPMSRMKLDRIGVYCLRNGRNTDFFSLTDPNFKAQKSQMNVQTILPTNIRKLRKLLVICYDLSSPWPFKSGYQCSGIIRNSHIATTKVCFLQENSKQSVQHTKFTKTVLSFGQFL